MENNQVIRDYHRLNVYLWLAVIISVLVLSLIAYLLHTANAVIPVENTMQINQILFLLAVVVAFAILFLKRSFFVPQKVIRVASSVHTDQEKMMLVLQRIRRNYIIVWALGEVICVLGFVSFVLTADQQYFLVFAVVSLYSILINIPRKVLVERCLELIQINSES